MKIIITGASRGIGASTAVKLAETGDHDLILISRDMRKLQELSQTIKSVNKKCSCVLIPADLSVEAEITGICAQITAENKFIDVLINNAGSLSSKPFIEFKIKEVNQMIMVNFLAPAILIRELLPLLQKSERAHVLNIGSMGGFQGSAKFPGLSYYSASKGALAVLTECLAEEYKETGVRFNCLALGSADTEMLREAFPGYTSPLSAGEMAGFVAGFAVTGHNFFNGKILPVALMEP